MVRTSSHSGLSQRGWNSQAELIIIVIIIIIIIVIVVIGRVWAGYLTSLRGDDSHEVVRRRGDVVPVM